MRYRRLRLKLVTDIKKDLSDYPFPGEELDVVCLSNIESGFFSSCAKDVAGIVLGESVGLPEIRKGAGLSREKLGCFEGDFRANERLAFRLKVNGSFLVFSWLDDPRSRLISGQRRKTRIAR